MGPSSEDPPSTHLCWPFWLLGFLSLLPGVWNTGAESKDSGIHTYLKKSLGNSVLFEVIVKQEGASRAEPKEITWSFGPLSGYKVMLRVYNGSDPPKWESLQDKYKQRVHISSMTTLLLENLTLNDTGQYQASVILNDGNAFNQVFQLTVYEPLPVPRILRKTLSKTQDQCSVTLECSVIGIAEKLNMTWESNNLPENLEQRQTSGPATNFQTLNVSLPLSQLQNQSNVSFTCVVSNSYDQKNATLYLGEICADEEPKNAPLRISLWICLALLVILGVGIFLWKTYGKKKKKETEKGPGAQEDCRDDDNQLDYVELNQEASIKDKDKDICERHMKEQETFTTVYSEVCHPNKVMNII